MRKSLCVSATISALAAWVSICAPAIVAQEQPGIVPPATTGGGTPKVEITEPKHDFGKVWVGDRLEHAFNIRNVGDAELKILAVKPKCGCTTPAGYPKTIAPGASADFLFRLNADRYRGDYSTTIDIDTNDPVNRTVHLTLAVHMQHHLEANPSFVLFDKLRPDASAQTTVMLTNKTDKELKLSTRGLLPAMQVFTWELKEITPGKTYQLLVSAKPPYPGKRNQQTIEIDLGIQGIPAVRIPCTAVVPERLDIEPRMLLIPVDSQPRTRVIAFTNNSDNDVKLLEAVSADSNIAVNVSTLKPGRDYRVNLAFPPNYVTPAEGTFITLKTDDTEQAEIKIPIRSPATATRPTAAPPDVFADARQAAAPPQDAETSSEAQPARLLIGIPAPVINAATFDGQPLQIGGSAGRVRLLTFYTSWCGYCRQALSSIEDLHKKYKDKGVEVLAINLDVRTGRQPRSEEQVLAHYKELNLSMPMIMDPYQLIGPRFRIKSHPTFVLIGKSGIVEAVHFGHTVPFGSTLPTQIDLLLQGKTRADFPPAVAEALPPAATQPTATQPAPRRDPVMELVGNPAPAATVKTIDGKETKIGAGSEAIQLLAFYASWCGFCKRAMPTVEQIHKDYKDKDIQVIAINQDNREGSRGRTEDQTVSTYKEWNLSMPMTMDPTQAIGQQFRVRGYPTFVLVGRNGIVEAAHVGATPTFDSTMRTELDLLLKGKNREAFPQKPAVPVATQPEQRNPAMQLTGKPAPSVSVQTPDGKEIKIGSGNGKVQLLAFYASWCGFCKAAMPTVEQLHKEFKDKGVEIIAINQDARSGRGARTQEQSLATYKEWNLSMPLTMDPDHKIGEQFLVRGYPTFFVIGNNGRVEAVYVGGAALSDGTARSLLESLLKNKPLTGTPGAGSGAPAASQPAT
ncbi:MAG: redoxin domain-containing protein [Phycisphaerae bacterium]